MMCCSRSSLQATEFSRGALRVTIQCRTDSSLPTHIYSQYVPDRTRMLIGPLNNPPRRPPHLCILNQSAVMTAENSVSEISRVPRCELTHLCVRRGGGTAANTSVFLWGLSAAACGVGAAAAVGLNVCAGSFLLERPVSLTHSSAMRVFCCTHRHCEYVYVV